MSAALLLAAEVADDGSTGLSFTAHLFLLAGSIGSMLFILLLLRRRQLRGKYAMLWTALGVVLIVLAIVPNLLTWISQKLGIYYPPVLFLVVAIGFLLVVLIQFSWELSRMEDRTRTLAEEIALLRTEIERLDAADQRTERNTTIMPSQK